MLDLAEELAASELLTKPSLSGASGTKSITLAVSLAVPTNVAPHATALKAFPYTVSDPFPAEHHRHLLYP